MTWASIIPPDRLPLYVCAVLLPGLFAIAWGLVGGPRPRLGCLVAPLFSIGLLLLIAFVEAYVRLFWILVVALGGTAP